MRLMSKMTTLDTDRAAFNTSLKMTLDIPGGPSSRATRARSPVSFRSLSPAPRGQERHTTDNHKGSTARARLSRVCPFTRPVGSWALGIERARVGRDGSVQRRWTVRLRRGTLSRRDGEL